MFGKDRVESRMNHRILVVEDDLVSQIVIAWILEEAGYCATVVSGGQTAIDTLMSIDYALVLMNCSVPGMAGFEATNAIRTGEAGTINPDIPIIALTTLGPDDDLQQFRAAGMVAHISKPADPDQLIALVEQHLGGHAAVSLSEPQTESDRSNRSRDCDIPQTPASQDWDPKLLDSIFDIFLSHVPQEIAGLQQALARGDVSELQDIGHRLRGSTAILRLSTLSALTSALEKAGRAGDLELAARITLELTRELKNLGSGRKSGSVRASV